MSFVIDPLWPWSNLWALLSAASGPVRFAVAVVALMALALPVLLYVRPWGAGPRAIVRAAAVVLLTLLAWLALETWGATGGLVARLEGLGLSALLWVPLALVGLTVWTYLGVAGASRRRVGAVLALRLAAFALALVAVLRPSLAFSERSRVRSQLHIVADYSESMSIQDEFDSLSRWDLVLRSLKRSEAALARLRDEQQVDVIFHRFAGDLADLQLDDPGRPDGKRTDFGAMLRRLYDGRDGRQPLRGLLVLSDGADNGTTPALAEAARWRGLPCPLHAFACGKPTTTDRQNDVALTAISAEPSPVPAKGKMVIKLTIDAPGFENTTVRLRLFLDDKEVKAQNEVLPLTAGNEVRLECTAPAKPGEVKITVRAEDRNRAGSPPQGDQFPLNNEIGTFATVSKEGVSVLLVDKQRVLEPQMICDALAKDARIRVTPVWLRGARPVDVNAEDLFQLEQKQYDVIIFGDITAAQVRAVGPNALKSIEQMVQRGAGFMMLGGYASFGNGDWKGTEVEKLLPVDLSVRGQEDERPVQMKPTGPGLRKFGYILRIADGQDVATAWAKLPKLDGITRLKASGSGIDSVLATADGDENRPLLVTQNYGQGRTLAFAGDTTFRWVRDEAGAQAHSRFWRQTVIWLARQEDAEGSVWVRPDTRRLPLHGELGFRVGVRSKGGVELKDGTFKVEVIGPGDVRTPVPTARGGAEERGTFTKTDAAGEYRVVVQGEAKDPSTGEVVRGEASARFLVYQDELELMRRAADHDFLKKLAAAGGGAFHRAEELPDFLNKLHDEPLRQARPKLDLWPNWRGTQRSPFFVGFFLAFVALLAGEWVLRRLWGLV
jgi:uncharacterized membrane protein